MTTTMDMTEAVALDLGPGQMPVKRRGRMPQPNPFTDVVAVAFETGTPRYTWLEGVDVKKQRALIHKAVRVLNRDHGTSLKARIEVVEWDGDDGRALVFELYAYEPEPKH
ncbi:hypothetical protein GCM10012275_28720 [Longimycelium tulufanense]|uniref:Uncharacterized protein n=1 Tax=Longimycelium tulufanense TaxID=907463 RepID=A0A8J3CE97_9PSEU|nr:hypothetical protein [Longimycelium tulufanense]GGM55855.1 hypothetical protein GCM10012275_28720 [Longimycelium tulufanense]